MSPSIDHQKASPIRKLLSRSAVFAVGDLLTKGARYITFPIFVAVLTVPEVGMLAVIQAVAMICWATATLGFGAAVRRFYRDTEGTTDELLISRLWIIRLCVAAIPTSMFAAFAWMFGTKFFPTIPTNWVLLALLSGYLRAGTDSVESWYIIREEPVKFRAFTFLRFLSTTTLVLILVVALKWGVYGAILGETIGAGVWCAIAGFLALGPLRSKRNAADTQVIAATSEAGNPIRRILRYSLPIIPHAVFLWMLVTFDRIILQQYVDNSAIGVYEIAYMYASLIIVVATAINAAWLPDFFRTGDKQNGPIRFARTADVFFACLFVVAFCLSILAGDLVGLLTGHKAEYAAATSLTRVILLGTGLQSLFVAFSQPLFFTGKTITLATVSGLGVAVNVISNLILIPRMGTLGAAWATNIAYGAMSFVMLIIVHKTYRVPWNYLGLLGCCVAFAIMTLTAPLGDESGFGQIAVRALACIAIAGLVFIWIFYSRRRYPSEASFGVTEPSGGPA